MHSGLFLVYSFIRLVILSRITFPSAHFGEWPTFPKAQNYAHSIETLAYSATIICVTFRLGLSHDFLLCDAFLVVSHEAFVAVQLSWILVMFRFNC